ncbi:DNA methyltransferase [Sphaerisporangium rhizosphaerae]|uniref:site-specific DNA-methyltransferase (adenine-specific) n=1 Tax=Sphaerisporangium rhizosphaerae TaxID=2269375 RepID=A0ABW2P621_9ACTN
MSTTRLLDLVDARDFRTLFIDELGWNNPDQPDRTFSIEEQSHTLTQIAGYKGMRIWYCPDLPTRKTQRSLDELIGRDNHERLVIFANESRQEWRWPRRAQTGGVNAKLLAHQHVVGDSDAHLAGQLEAIAIDFEEDLPLVELLNRMRQAFDSEAEAASVQAARLMGTLYAELDQSKVPPHDATLLLARLLFLLFGDDTGMWGKKPDLFHRYLLNHTSDVTLNTDMEELFRTLDTPDAKRKLPSGSSLTPFPYVNGGLYADPLPVPPLAPRFREALLSACEFDWAIISPAVFGSMFQTVKDKDARRHGGEHYTTEENIFKTIGPLFLDEYQGRLENAWDNKAELTKLHNDLGRLRFFDPACGCGNFLIVAYRELRALELELLKRRRHLDQISPSQAAGVKRSQMSLDVTGEIKVTLDHFYGIEIEEWPARIAETAMLLVDQLANQRMEQDFGLAPDRLPIAIAPTILHGNALRTNWETVCPPGPDVIVFGNPPFSGRGDRTAAQTADQKFIWGKQYNINLDYVTCWYLKTVRYYGNIASRWAFVSTSSVCQGEPVATLWRPILDAGWRCRFAHRSLQWDSEAPGKAAVHVSIVGFDKAKSSPKPTLWTYPAGGHGNGTAHLVARINPYLVEGQNLLVVKHVKPLSPQLPEAAFGSMPNDGGNLLVEVDDYPEVAADPVAAKYLRRFIQAKELLHNRQRWCLWMVDLDPADVDRSDILRTRIEAVRKHRANSKSPTTSARMHPPHLFGQIAQPDTSYLGIPRHVSEHRRFYAATRYEADTICGDANFLIPDPDGFALGVISSTMFMIWQKTIGGRLKSDLRFSKTFTYNTFPLPSLTADQRVLVIEGGARIVAAREAHLGSSLATLYDPYSMPNDLVEAHRDLDKVIDMIFNITKSDDAGRQRTLFRKYAQLTGQGVLPEV